MDGGASDAQERWAGGSEVQGPRFDALADPPPRLIVVGAVPLAAALQRAARGIGWRTWLVDPRARFATAAAFPDAEAILHAWPAAAFDALGALDEATAVVALAHAAELDDPALTLALRSSAFYVGAMGSRNTQRRRRERLRAAGVSTGELERLAGPCGLDLGGRTAAEAALAILAEAVAARHGRRGGRLTDSAEAIHSEGRP